VTLRLGDGEMAKGRESERAKMRRGEWEKTNRLKIEN